MRNVFLLICFLVLGVGCSTSKARGLSSDLPSVAHFVSEGGKEWREFEGVWNDLSAYYGDAMPPRVWIEFTGAGASRFDTTRNRILLDRTHFANRPERLVAHETSHLALHRLTGGASTQESFRFMDEGFAEIFSNRIVGRGEVYKNEDALPTAAVQYSQANVSFDKVQKWSEYFGGPGAGKWWAYEVGASFDFYVIDQFGEAKLKELFVALGDGHDLGKALVKALGQERDAIERGWKQYLSQIPIAQETPKVVTFVPQNGATGVSTGLSEIFVELSVPMNQRIITVVARCDDGVCYKNAYWKDSKTLAVRLPEGLRAHYEYVMTLGRSDKPLVSRTGAPMPVTEWKFSTK